MSRIVHFEIHASQPEQLVKFYTALLGWHFQHLEAMDYWLIDTGTKDKPGIDGGLVRRRGPAPADMQSVNAFVCTAEVTSLDEALAKNAMLGGDIALPKMAVSGVGWLAYVKDPDGNILGLLQPDETAV